MASHLPESAKIAYANFQTSIFIYCGTVITFVFIAWVVTELLAIKSLVLRKLIFSISLILGLLVASKFYLLRF